MKLLEESLNAHGGTAEEAMKHVIDQADKNDATALFHLGTALTRFRHYFAAIEVLTRATELAPRNAAAFGNLGISFYTIGDCDKALHAFMTALELDPSASRSGDWNRRTGSCLIYKRDYIKAEKYCSKARELLPSDPAPKLCLGQAQFSQTKYAEALLSYKEANSMSSMSAYPPHKGAAQSGVLASLAKLNRLAEATTALNIAPGSILTTRPIEQFAADAVLRLERSEKPKW